jgi:transposase
MHGSSKSRRRHSDEFKAQVLAACAEPGASVAAVARTFGLNDNLLHQWRRGRGAGGVAAPACESAAVPASQFVALSLPASPAVTRDTPGDGIRVELKRGALSVNVLWPASAGAECAAWLRELLR